VVYGRGKYISNGEGLRQCGVTAMSEDSLLPGSIHAAHCDDAPRMTMSKTPKAKLTSKARYTTARDIMVLFLLKTGGL
jgi:hypothetical protein